VKNLKGETGTSNNGRKRLQQMKVKRGKSQTNFSYFPFSSHSYINYQSHVIGLGITLKRGGKKP